MNAREYFERAAELERAHVPFALATVVERAAPVSSHLGDRAIVHADGSMQGFVGGSCSRDIVRRHALDAMRSGGARLVQIRPGAAATPQPDRPSTVVVPMTCASEGAVDVYIEPHLPARPLLVAGFTPVAAELARLGSMLDGYSVTRVVEASELQGALEAIAGAERARLVAVVASQGHYDEDALEAILREALPAYVGLVASRKRAADVFAAVEQRGIARERIASVHNPAGLDIGAKRPGDVAISILAEIIASVAAEEQRGVAVATPEDLTTHSCCHAEASP